MPSDAFKNQEADLLCEFFVLTMSKQSKVMPDDHSDVVPLLPIPNRTVKRVSADDSADCPCESRTSSGSYSPKSPPVKRWAFCFLRSLVTKPMSKMPKAQSGVANHLVFNVCCTGMNQLVQQGHQPRLKLSFGDRADRNQIRTQASPAQKIRQRQ